MIIATAVASIGIFLGALWLLDVVRVAAEAIATAQSALAIARDESVDDAARKKRSNGPHFR